jgi:hypothetical protein
VDGVGYYSRVVGSEKSFSRSLPALVIIAVATN